MTQREFQIRIVNRMDGTEEVRNFTDHRLALEEYWRGVEFLNTTSEAGEEYEFELIEILQQDRVKGAAQ